jgi:hypothetical protein
MPTTPRACPVCGSTLDMVFRSVLWTELGDLWELSPEEFKYVNHQQGVLCQACGCNLRAQALGLAITQAFGHRGPFRKFVRTIRGRWLRVLEINQVGALSGHFSRLSRKELRVYPSSPAVSAVSPCRSWSADSPDRARDGRPATTVIPPSRGKTTGSIPNMGPMPGGRSSRRDSPKLGSSRSSPPPPTRSSAGRVFDPKLKRSPVPDSPCLRINFFAGMNIHEA